jgi:DNA polymerase-3 subunit epsilon/ATP-dependent DNA helicase DinG
LSTSHRRFDPHPTYAALDLETTGLNPERDDIIEVAAVRFIPGQVLATYDSLVRPKVDLSLRVRQITGIEPADLESAPDVDTVLAELEAFVGDAILVGHSVGHDLRYLLRYGCLLDREALDTFELASILVPEAPRHGLRHLLDYFGLEVSGLHRALADAHAHRLLFESLLERVRTLDPSAVAAINRLAAGVDWPPRRIFHWAGQNLVPGPTAPSAPDPRQATEEPHHSDEGGASPSRADPVPLDIDWLEGLISPDGQLAREFDGFQDRAGQRAMLRQVANAFDRGDHLLIEAGTGTGKSLAYLLPAAAWAVANGRRVVLSTHTIALQHQLIAKDIPLVRRLLGVDVRAAILKGRSHYLCKSRLASLTARGDLDLPGMRAAARVLTWAPRTATGDRAELLLQPDEMPTWRSLSAEGDACTPSRCPYARQGTCWIHKARARAEAAHLIIVNHALLLSDMLVDNRLIPGFDRLIVDEAHHLEDVATSSLGFRCSVSTVRDAVAPFESRGFVERIVAAAAASDLSEMARGELVQAAMRVEEAGRRAAVQAGVLFETVAAFQAEQSDRRDPQLRLTAARRHSPSWEQIEAAWDDLREPLTTVRQGLQRLSETFVTVESVFEGDGLLADLGASGRDVADLIRGLDRIISDTEPNDITWIDKTGGDKASLHLAPLHVGDVLATRLFAGKQTVVLTSATLRAGDDFELVRDRLGLPEAEASVVESPFEYSTAVLLYLPTDIPEPGDPQHAQVVGRTLIELATATKGRTLVLFTSHSELRAAYHLIRGPLGSRGITVLGQGLDGSRINILEGFRDPGTQAVLLGTRSFWEGIDVPGEDLSCVVIARLPFEVPTEPVFAARSETFDDPFGEYAVPNAVLRFRQGFGRLIRSVHDSGVVVVLDRRVLTKSYGDAFLDALPPARRRTGPLASLASAALQFLNGEPMLADGPWYNSGDFNRLTERG